jgi:hypothetical protein
MIKRSVFGCLAACVLSVPASAAVTNLGFEQGLTGWTATGNVTADNASAYSGTYSALLTAQVPHNSAPTSLSQTFSLNAGETFTVYAQFTGNEGGPKALDTANVSIGLAGQNNNVMLSWALPTDTGTGPWQTISFTAPTTGLYEFRAQVDNVHDSSSPSTLRLDSVAAAPEPATWAMMLIGFAGIGVLAYRGRKRAAAA